MFGLLLTSLFFHSRSFIFQKFFSMFVIISVLLPYCSRTFSLFESMVFILWASLIFPLSTKYFFVRFECDVVLRIYLFLLSPSSLCFNWICDVTIYFPVVITVSFIFTFHFNAQNHFTFIPPETSSNIENSVSSTLICFSLSLFPGFCIPIFCIDYSITV